MEQYIELFRHISDKSVKYNNYLICRDELPRNKRGDTEWSKIIGSVFDFSYQGFDGYLKIIDYKYHKTESSKIYLTINDSDIIYVIGIYSFKKIGFNELIRIRYYDYNIGTIIKNKEILDISHKDKSIIYKYKCLLDGYIGWTTQSNIKRNSGNCPVCKGMVVMEGINDITTTDPWMIDYFQGGYDEAKLYTANSLQIINAKCPHCGKIKKTSVGLIKKNKGIKCECSDKISYPEKCMINLLNILNEDYVYQCGEKILNWLVNNYTYDFYIKSKSVIIETHGKQHYEKLSNKSSWTSLEIIQEHDNHKQQLAFDNGIKNYIILDCRKSDIEQFKESVMKSQLPTLFNFTENDIDWNLIDMQSTRNIVKEVCIFHKQNPALTEIEVGNKFHINKRLVSNYYKIGKKFGWCDYNKLQICWIAHFNRNTHFIINDYYFYNTEDVTNRSYDVFGEKILGSSINTYLRNNTIKPFNNKYNVRKVSHKEYLLNNKIYPSYITEEIINGLLLKYEN